MKCENCGGTRWQTLSKRKLEYRCRKCGHVRSYIKVTYCNPIAKAKGG